MYRLTPLTLLSCSAVLTLGLWSQAGLAQEVKQEASGTQQQAPRPAVAQQALDFATAYRMALAQDPDWRTAQAQRDADHQEKALGRSRLLPNLSYSYSRARNWQDSRQQTTQGTYSDSTTYTSYSSGFTLSQPLFDAAAWAQYRQGSETATAAEYTLERARQALAVQVLKAYTDQLYAADKLELSQAQKRSLLEDAKRAQAYVAGGEGTRTDEIEIRARLKVVDAQIIQAQDALADASDKLKKMIGAVIMEGPLVGLKSTRALALDSGRSAADWRRHALAHNPEINASRHQLEVARQRIHEAWAGHLPTVQAFARHQVSESDAANQVGQHYKTDSIGIQLSVPLFQGGRTIADSSQASARYEVARDKLDGQIADTLNDVDHQYRTLVSSQQLGDAYAEAIEASQQRIHATRKSIEGGERTNVDALDAEEKYYETQGDLRRARYDELLAWLSLRWQAGELDNQDILQVAQYFSVKPLKGLSLGKTD